MPVKFAGTLLICAAWLFSVYHFSIGWTHSILDEHAFRQAQTAISAWYLRAGAPFWNYETPVLGAPWSIPIEFPLYQWLVAKISVATGYGLESCGRLVSALSFALGVGGLSGFLRESGVSRTTRIMFTWLLLTSPVYLFWSRTFMIESMAWGFGCLFLFAASRSLRRPGWRAFFLAAIFATLCGLVKITTLAVFICFFILLLMPQFIAWRRPFVFSSGFGPVLAIGAGIVIASIVCLAWIRYVDQVKMANPLARNLLSSRLMETWTFGGWNQRFDPVTWKFVLLERVSMALTGFWLLFPAAVLFFHFRRHLSVLSAALGTYAIAFIAFTNVNLMHDYYAYAQSAFLVMAAALMVGSCVESGHRTIRILGLLIFVAMVVENYGFYRDVYLPSQRKDVPPMTATAALLKSKLALDDIFVAWGLDWSPALAYQAERRAVMERDDISPDNPVWNEILAGLSGKRIASAVFCGQRRVTPEFVMPRLRRIGIDHFEATWSDGCLVVTDVTAHSPGKVKI